MWIKRRDAFYKYMFRRSVIPLVMILAVIIGSVLFFYRSIVLHEAEKNKEYSVRRVEASVNSVDWELSENMLWSRQLMHKTTFQKFIYLYDQLDVYTRFQLQLELKEDLNDLSYRDNNIKEVCVYIPSLEKAITSRHAQTSIKDWMVELEKKQDGTYSMEDGTAASIMHFDGEDNNAVVIVLWDTKQIIKQIKTRYLSSEREVILLWDSLEIPDSEWIYKDSVYFPYRIMCKPVITSEVNQFIKRVGVFSILFMIICLVIAVFTMMTWYTQIYYPLHRLLIEAFDHMEKNDFSYRIDTDKGNATFAPIYKKYNHMMDSMQQYIEANLQQQILVSQSNLKQLQSQISPHFMYNSYYILYRMLRRKDLENSMYLAEYLGSFYQYITRNADDEKRLCEELKHAKNYAEIQKYRFGDNLRIQIEEPDEEIASVYVPRLILQPILENVFKYGYENGNGDPIQLRLSFEVKNDKDFSIIIENSGELLEETLEMLQEKLSSNDLQIETTAIINIHRRLQIYFGKKSGLSVERSTMGGLKVIMHICKEE